MELVGKKALENALKAYMRRAQNVFDEDMPFVLADFQNMHKLCVDWIQRFREKDYWKC